MELNYTILTQNGTNNTGTDGARDRYFAAGNRDGIIKGSLNEGTLRIDPSNGVMMDSCVLLICGNPVILNAGWSKTFSSKPSTNERKAIVAQLDVDNNGHKTFDILFLPTTTKLVKNNLFKTLNTAGTYQVEIGRFTLNTSGLVENLTRTIDVITGGGTADSELHWGTITAYSLGHNEEPEADFEQRYDEEQKHMVTDVSLGIPSGSIDNLDETLSPTSHNAIENQAVTNELANKVNMDDTLQRPKVGQLNIEMNDTNVTDHFDYRRLIIEDKRTIYEPSKSSGMAIKQDNGNNHVNLIEIGIDSRYYANHEYDEDDSNSYIASNEELQVYAGGYYKNKDVHFLSPAKFDKAVVVPTPTDNTDAANKGYVDNNLDNKADKNSLYAHYINGYGSAGSVCFTTFDNKPTITINNAYDLYSYLEPWINIYLPCSGSVYINAQFSANPVCSIRRADGSLYFRGKATDGSYNTSDLPYNITALESIFNTIQVYNQKLI